MKGLSKDKIAAVLAQPKRGRRTADHSHPLGFLRAVRDQLGPPPYDADALLELAKREPGFFEVTRHAVLDPHSLVEAELRDYAAQVCKEVYEVSYVDGGHWMYDDPETCDLDHLADHLRFRRETDRARGDNFKRLKDIAAQRAAEVGKSVEQLLAEADGRFNEAHVLADLQVVADDQPVQP